MSKEVVFAAASDTGLVRSENQDAYYAGCISDNTDTFEMHLFLVADGMGGYLGGGTAAKMAVDTFQRELVTSKQLWPDTEDTANWLLLLKEAVLKTNSRIVQAQVELNLPQMGTTLTAAVLYEHMLYITHIGDSRLYHLYENGLYQITSDHSYVAEMLRRRLISTEEARKHPKRNVMSQALGVSWEIEVEGKSLELSTGSTLLVCSDGLSSMLSDAEILAALQQYDNPASQVEQLIDCAKRSGGTDNITAIVARYGQDDEEISP